jgi:hypothetical protein
MHGPLNVKFARAWIRIGNDLDTRNIYLHCCKSNDNKCCRVCWQKRVRNLRNMPFALDFYMSRNYITCVLFEDFLKV